MVRNRLIQYWVRSLPDSFPEDASDYQLETAERSSIQRTRHHKLLQGDKFAFPHHEQPDTPPPIIESEEGIPKTPPRVLRSSSEPGDDVFVEDLDPTPKAPSRSLSSRAGFPAKQSKRKPKHNPDGKLVAPLKERSNLLFLEKLVNLKAVKVATHLPEDVRDLYNRVKSAAVYKEAILPPEMREEINMILQEEAREVSFRKPLATTDETGKAKAAAWLLHTQLCEILEEAERADLLKRHECGWNAHVQGMVLGLVFSSLLSRAGFRSQQSRHGVARYEAVQAAGISKDSAPYWKEGGPAVTVTSTEQSTDESAEDYEKSEPIPSRSRSKKVDYVVVLRILDDKPLQQAIRQAAFNKESNTCYVNQTAYYPIFDNPIAVSIETEKTSSNDDPMLQLGLWVAAWHKRMYTLRQRLFPPPPGTWLPVSVGVGPAIPPPLLVSVPLIQVVGHEWKLYFACDSVDSISLYGPVGIGSTSDILDIYTLVSCLLSIQDWVESTFYERMKTWFLHENDNRGKQEDTQAQ